MENQDQTFERANTATRKAVLDGAGWPIYRTAQLNAHDARAAYYHASEHGYPTREAATMRDADEVLAAVGTQYPMAAAYARAESYSMADNFEKSEAGRHAMQAIESGSDPIAAIKKMEADWLTSASRMVEN